MLQNYSIDPFLFKSLIPALSLKSHYSLYEENKEQFFDRNGISVITLKPEIISESEGVFKSSDEMVKIISRDFKEELQILH